MNLRRSIHLCAAVSLFVGTQALEVRANKSGAGTLKQLPELATQIPPSNSAGTATKADRSQMKLHSSLPEEYVLTLSELRDAGLALQQIRGEAIHIYLEAARKPVPLNDDPKLVEPKTIPSADLAIDGTCEPVRRDWLVFFVGTIEPILHLLTDDVEKVENEETKLVMPNVEKEQADKLWREWAQGVQDLNRDLDNIFMLLGSNKIDNKGVANQAIAIFNSCQKLEDVRVRVHKIIQESEPK
jgi:hypothetical protein